MLVSVVVFNNCQKLISIVQLREENFQVPNCAMNCKSKFVISEKNNNYRIHSLQLEIG